MLVAGFSRIKPVVAIPPTIVSDNTAQVSPWLDRFGYELVEFVIATGSLQDSDMAASILVEESDASDGTGAAAVADEQLVGTEAAAGFGAAADNATRRIGYAGRRRFVRITVTPCRRDRDGAAVLPARTRRCWDGFPTP
jgi:hypothetical protein